MARLFRSTRLAAALLSGVLLLGACAPYHVYRLSSDDLGGRNNDTPGSVAAQDYIINYLIYRGAVALDGTKGRASYRSAIPSGTNIVAKIPGTDLSDEIVLVGAHYDHLGSCDAQGGDAICNGATDNAAGVAIALEIMAGFASSPTPPRRTVMFAFWDREEDGLLGSSAWVAANPSIVDDVVAYVNYDIQGANLLPTLRNETLALGAETGGPSFRAAIDAAGTASPLSLSQLSVVFGQGRSDHVSFAAQSVPTVFFTDATGPCYHTTRDDFGVSLDVGKLIKQTTLGVDLTRALAAGTTTPVWNPTAPPATYADAVVIHTLVERALPDIGRFTASQQSTLVSIEVALQTVVDNGPAAFDAAAVGTLLGQSLTLVNILESGACDGFLN